MNQSLLAMTRKVFTSCLTACWLISSGCGAMLAQQPSPVRATTEQEPIDIASVIERVRVLEESLPLLACGPEIKALLQEVRLACGQPVDGGPRAMCSDTELKAAIYKAERELDVRVGKKLLSVLRHEVLYLSPNGDLASRRADRLSVLAKERRMPSTKFLIIAGGEDGPHRARTAREMLIRLGIPERERVTADDGSTKEVERFETAWKYSLNVQSTDLRSYDRPSAFEPKDMSRAVFVFRTDYL